MYIGNGLVQLTSEQIRQKISYSHLFGLEKLEDNLFQFCKAFLTADRNQIKNFKIYDLVPSVLLYGAPNTGKTTLCYRLFQNIKQDITNEINFYSLDVGYMLDPALGQSSRNLEEAFNQLKESCQAQESSAFLVLDELDAFCMARSRLNEHDAVRRAMTTLMLELDKLHPEQKILVFGITNVPNLIDTAIVRRFSLRKHIDANLSFDAFCEYLRYLTEPLNYKLNDDLLDELFEIYQRRPLKTGDIKSIFKNLYIESIAFEDNFLLKDRLKKSLESSFSTEEHLRQQLKA